MMLLAALLMVKPPLTERVVCQLDAAPPTTCVRQDEVLPDGRHRMSFLIGKRRLRFEGSRQSGWWSGRIDGRPAMGFERNRGNMVFATADLKTNLAWWYPTSEHGTY